MREFMKQIISLRNKMATPVSTQAIIIILQSGCHKGVDCTL